MAKIYEVRYKDASNAIVANQHATEQNAKIDAKAISKEKGRSLLGEVDYEKKQIIRVCEFQGGVQGKWENRDGGAFIPCRIILTLEDTKQEEPNIEAQAKMELTDEQIAEKKRTLERLRAASVKPERKPKASGTTPTNDKREKLIEAGHQKELVDVICSANLHIDSPNYNALIALWKGNVNVGTIAGMDSKSLNTLMMKLRVQLVQNDTGKSIVTMGSAKDLTYKLIDFKLEVEEVA